MTKLTKKQMSLTKFRNICKIIRAAVKDPTPDVIEALVHGTILSLSMRVQGQFVPVAFTSTDGVEFYSSLELLAVKGTRSIKDALKSLEIIKVVNGVNQPSIAPGVSQNLNLDLKEKALKRYLINNTIAF